MTKHDNMGTDLTQADQGSSSPKTKRTKARRTGVNLRPSSFVLRLLDYDVMITGTPTSAQS